MQGSGYVGRFAPVTDRKAVAHGQPRWPRWRRGAMRKPPREGTWLVRMEDLDPPREVAGASDDILRTLEGLACLGMEACATSRNAKRRMQMHWKC